MIRYELCEGVSLSSKDEKSWRLNVEGDKRILLGFSGDGEEQYGTRTITFGSDDYDVVGEPTEHGRSEYLDQVRERISRIKGGLSDEIPIEVAEDLVRVLDAIEEGKVRPVESDLVHDLDLLN